MSSNEQYETTNHGLHLPEVGEELTGGESWAKLLNQNFTSVDGRLIVQDTADRRSEYVPVTGATYVATDTHDVYIGGDGDWVDIEVAHESDLYTDEQVEDTVGALLTGSGATTVSYDDGSGTLTIDSTDTNTDTQLTNEEVEDVVGNLVTGSGATSVSYNDSNDTLVIDSTDTNTDTDTQRTDEEIEDVVGTLLSSSEATTVTYDDANGMLTIGVDNAAIRRSQEEIEDFVSGLLTDGGATTISYDDNNNTLTISSTDTQLTDEEVQSIINSDSDHGSAPHNYFSGNYGDLSNTPSLFSGQWGDLSGKPSSFNPDNHGDGSHSEDYAKQSDLHTRYTNWEAQSAVNGSNIDIGGDADTVDGYDIQVDGNDGSGIINFKTQ